MLIIKYMDILFKFKFIAYTLIFFCSVFFYCAGDGLCLLMPGNNQVSYDVPSWSPGQFNPKSNFKNSDFNKSVDSPQLIFNFEETLSSVNNLYTKVANISAVAQQMSSLTRPDVSNVRIQNFIDNNIYIEDLNISELESTYNNLQNQYRQFASGINVEQLTEQEMVDLEEIENKFKYVENAFPEITGIKEEFIEIKNLINDDETSMGEEGADTGDDMEEDSPLLKKVVSIEGEVEDLENRYEEMLENSNVDEQGVDELLVEIDELSDRMDKISDIPDVESRIKSSIDKLTILEEDILDFQNSGNKREDDTDQPLSGQGEEIASEDIEESYEQMTGDVFKGEIKKSKEGIKKLIEMIPEDVENYDEIISQLDYSLIFLDEIENIDYDSLPDDEKSELKERVAELYKEVFEISDRQGEILSDDIKPVMDIFNSLAEFCQDKGILAEEFREADNSSVVHIKDVGDTENVTVMSQSVEKDVMANDVSLDARGKVDSSSYSEGRDSVAFSNSEINQEIEQYVDIGNNDNPGFSEEEISYANIDDVKMDNYRVSENYAGEELSFVSLESGGSVDTYYNTESEDNFQNNFEMNYDNPIPNNIVYPDDNKENEIAIEGKNFDISFMFSPIVKNSGIYKIAEEILPNNLALDVRSLFSPDGILEAVSIRNNRSKLCNELLGNSSYVELSDLPGIKNSMRNISEIFNLAEKKGFSVSMPVFLGLSLLPYSGSNNSNLYAQPVDVVSNINNIISAFNNKNIRENYYKMLEYNRNPESFERFVVDVSNYTKVDVKTLKNLFNLNRKEMENILTLVAIYMQDDDKVILSFMIEFLNGDSDDEKDELFDKLPPLNRNDVVKWRNRFDSLENKTVAIDNSLELSNVLDNYLLENTLVLSYFL